MVEAENERVTTPLPICNYGRYDPGRRSINTETSKHQSTPIAEAPKDNNDNNLDSHKFYLSPFFCEGLSFSCCFCFSRINCVMRGSVVLIGMRNKQSCFSLNKNKKTQLIYLGKNRQARAKEYSENYKKLRAIVEQMAMINMTLLKENACL